MAHILHQEKSGGKNESDPIVAEIYRFDPSSNKEPRMQQYVVPYRHRMSVFTILREIYEYQDPTLAFRNQQCGRGICGLCQVRVRINGSTEKIVKGCTIPIKPGDHIIIKPFKEEKIIRDLVVAF